MYAIKPRGTIDYFFFFFKNPIHLALIGSFLKSLFSRHVDEMVLRLTGDR